MKIQKNKDVLLVNDEKSYLIPCTGKFSCKYGAVDLDKLAGKKFGSIAKIGKKKFTVINPNMRDIMFKKFQRGPQVILPEDAAMIVAFTGIGHGSKVVEAGTGSAFLSTFLANIGCEVHTYESRKEHFKKAAKNIARSGLKIENHNKDIIKARLPKDLDLVMLDMKSPELVIKKAYLALKPGAYLAIYSLHIEQLQRVIPKLKKFSRIRIVENFQRNWQMQGKDETFTRPKTHMMGHTGFLVFARKF
jgi:tRNA (adenine57-N1/adenine58-N1)-methyltransferase catalytic subunit